MAAAIEYLRYRLDASCEASGSEKLSFEMKVQENVGASKVLPSALHQVAQLLAALRPTHWIKNGFLFVSLFFSGHFYNPSEIVLTIRGFVSFSLVTSAIYIFNDLMDRERDALSDLTKH